MDLAAEVLAAVARAGDGKNKIRRGRIVADCARLESVYAERHRGFESLPLRNN